MKVSQRASSLARVLARLLWRACFSYPVTHERRGAAQTRHHLIGVMRHNTGRASVWDTMSAPDVPPISIPPPERAYSDTADDREAAREELFGGARLLVADVRVVYLLLNQARARAITRLFGISGPGSALVTIIALGLASQTAHRKVTRVLKAPGAPELGPAAIGASVLTESVRSIAGPGIGEFPLLGPLVLFAVAGHALRPVLRSTVHGVRTSARRAHAGLDHRYGHVVRRNRPRAEI